MILFWYQNKDSSLFKNIESMAWSAKKTFLELLLRSLKLRLNKITNLWRGNFNALDKVTYMLYIITCADTYLYIEYFLYL